MTVSRQINFLYLITVNFEKKVKWSGEIVGITVKIFKT